MKHLVALPSLPAIFLVGAVLLATPCARADVPGINMDFENYELGELLGQDAWGYAGGWAGSWEIVSHEGPDGKTTKCIGTAAGMTSNWPRGHYTIATDSLTRFGWPTTGKYRLSFDFLFVRALHANLNIYFFGAQKTPIFKFEYNNQRDRVQVTPGYGVLANSVAANALWHHVDVDMDFATSKIDFYCDDRTVSSDLAFTTSAESLDSFGQIILQYAGNGADNPGANDGFYLDNIRIYRTDVDQKEITVVLFR